MGKTFIAFVSSHLYNEFLKMTVAYIFDTQPASGFYESLGRLGNLLLTRGSYSLVIPCLLPTNLGFMDEKFENEGGKRENLPSSVHPQILKRLSREQVEVRVPFQFDCILECNQELDNESLKKSLRKTFTVALRTEDPHLVQTKEILRKVNPFAADLESLIEA
jgi:hypothetical protein